jgi:hypothetical protein
MIAPLHQELEKVEWGEYRIGDLFEVQTVKSFDEGKLNLIEEKQPGLFEFIGRTRSENGIKGYVEKLEIEPNPKNVISVSQIGTIIAQLRRAKWYASQNIFSLIPKKNFENLISLFGVSAVNRSLRGTFSDGYSNYPTLIKLKNLKIQLPTKNNEIDFAFMERFIAELEAERIAELEAYLLATGLKDYTLTEEERKVLAEFERGEIEWGEFRIGELFDVNSYKKRFDANKVEIKETGKPYVVRTALNNGIRGYIKEDEEFLNEGNTISFGQDTATMFYQEKPYFTGDKIKIVKSKDERFNKQNAMFFVSTMTKSFSSFAWGSSSFNVKIIANQIMNLPTQNKQPDYEKMETFISAIQKLVIKDVVLYADRKIAATREVATKK